MSVVAFEEGQRQRLRRQVMAKVERLAAILEGEIEGSRLLAEAELLDAWREWQAYVSTEGPIKR
jgi:hypothetical protein